MLKGIQKNMIWVRTPESRFFEAAYFVMRPNACSAPPREGEMLREANRLLSEGTRKTTPRREQRLWQRLLPFLAGLASGAVLSLLLALALFP